MIIKSKWGGGEKKHAIFEIIKIKININGINLTRSPKCLDATVLR